MKPFAKIGASVVVVVTGGWYAISALTGGTLGNPLCGGDWFRCSGGDCQIPVSNVTCGTPGPGNYGHMDVQQEFSVCKPSRMVWALDDHTLSFPATGIALKSSNSDFDPTDTDHKDWKFTWKNRHRNLGKIEYAVTVQKDGRDCAHVDPFVYNE